MRNKEKHRSSAANIAHLTDLLLDSTVATDCSTDISVQNVCTVWFSVPYDSEIGQKHFIEHD
jgi:hypothetical protein